MHLYCLLLLVVVVEVVGALQALTSANEESDPALAPLAATSINNAVRIAAVPDVSPAPQDYSHGNSEDEKHCSTSHGLPSSPIPSNVEDKESEKALADHGNDTHGQLQLQPPDKIATKPPILTNNRDGRSTSSNGSPKSPTVRSPRSGSPKRAGTIVGTTETDPDPSEPMVDGLIKRSAGKSGFRLSFPLCVHHLKKCGDAIAHLQSAVSLLTTNLTLAPNEPEIWHRTFPLAAYQQLSSCFRSVIRSSQAVASATKSIRYVRTYRVILITRTQVNITTLLF
jgi:hypothetical protein